MSRAQPVTVADSETDPFLAGRLPRPFVWGWTDGRREEVFWEDQTGFARFLRGTPQYCYAHNGGRFDWHYLADEIRSGRCSIHNGRLAELHLGRAKLRDSFLLVPVALSAYEKQRFDYAKLEAERRDAHAEEIVGYVLSDVRFTHELVSRFVERFGAVRTLAQAALADWSRGRRVRWPSSRTDARWRPWYTGGRVEALAVGEHQGPVYEYDVRSAYPAAMLAAHPWGASVEPLRRLPDGDALGPCLVHFQGRSWGALPVRRKGRPLGWDYSGELREFRATGWEVAAGLDTGRLDVERVIACYRFAQTITFSEYVGRWYEEKERAERDGDKAGRLFAKLMLNSLYGKMGQDPSRWHQYRLIPKHTPCPEGWTWCGRFGARHDLIRRPHPNPWRAYRSVATAASITGHVRATMLRALDAVGEPLYCDTDSVWTRDPGKLDVGQGLGKWALDGTYDRMIVARRKVYAAKSADGWKVRAKGARLTWLQVRRLARGESVKWEAEAPTFSVFRGAGFRHLTLEGESK